MSDQTSSPSTPDYFYAQYMFPRRPNGQDHSGLTHDRSTKTDYNEDIGGYASSAHTGTNAGNPSNSVTVNRSSRASSKTISAASTPSEMPKTARGPHTPCAEPRSSLDFGRSGSHRSITNHRDGFLNAEYIFNPTFSKSEAQTTSIHSRIASPPTSPCPTSSSTSECLSTTSDAGRLSPGAETRSTARSTSIKKERRKSGSLARSMDETLAYLKHCVETEEAAKRSRRYKR